mmetsp:Transcript_6867/g.12742  ORF Transcript_6867/g.12742 Transcript_6867/m.12742 type:complete len:184 (-) Transcript_6867:439-990(-)
MKNQYIVHVNQEFGFRQYDSLPEILFAAFTCISIGLNVLVMTISSWCLVWGNDLAIRGDGYDSLKKAVDGLYEERKMTVRLFLCGIGSYICSGFMLGWTAMHYEARVAIMTVFALIGLTTTLYITLITRPRFRVPKVTKMGSNRPDMYLMGNGAFDPEQGRSTQNQTATANPVLGASSPGSQR